jgi:FMN reductase (NADPH)/FMN reductase [NAD(P)H]
VIKLIQERKSVRLFEDKLISEDIKSEIINAAFEAPTAGNMMFYSIVDVTDFEIKEKLSILCDNQKFIAKSPLVLVFIADYQKWYDIYKYNGIDARNPQEGDLLLAIQDSVIAAQNTVLAAQSFGIGSCYIGDILENYEEVTKLLNLSPYTLPISMLIYGYPTKKQIDRKKPQRFEKEFMVFENRYDRLEKDKLMKMIQIRNEKENLLKDEIESIKELHKRKYDSDFAKEMNRSVKKYLENFRG